MSRYLGEVGRVRACHLQAPYQLSGLRRMTGNAEADGSDRIRSALGQVRNTGCGGAEADADCLPISK